MSQTPLTRVLFKRTLSRLLMGVFAAFVISLLSTSVIGLLSSNAQAATSSTLNFQARLLTNAGGIVADGSYNVEFKLYSVSSGGSALWTETYYDSNGATAGNDNRVQVRAGYLSVYLGSLTSFPGTINWDQDLYITMNVGGSSQTATPTYDGEMTPRLKLTAVPYAFKAGQLAQYNGTTGFTSTLSIAQPTGGNQTFTIPDQGANGSYTLLTTNAANTGYIQNQLAVAQTANFFIQASNSGINGTVGATIKAASGGQTVDLFQLQDASGNINAAFNSSGNILRLGRIASSGTVSPGTLILADGTTSNFGATIASQTLTADRRFLLPDTALATTGSPGTICVYNGASSNCPAATGSAFYVQNGTTVQTNTNFYIRSAATGSVVGVLEGANGQTADLLQLNTYNGTTSSTVARFTAAGNLQVAGSVDTNTTTSLSVGTVNANAVSISKSGVTTTVNGALAVTEGSTFNGAVGISGTNTLTVGTGLTSLGGGLSVTAGTTTLSGNLLSNGNTTIGDATTDRLTVTSQILGTSALVFQGSADDANTTTFSITNPTAARTITFPNSSGTVTLNPASGAYLQTVPTATANNTVSPTTASVVGLTVNATSGTTAVAAIFNQAHNTNTADTVQINSTNTAATQTNGLSVARNGAGGTTTNLVNVTNTAGTVTNGITVTATTAISNGINFTGAGGFTNLINSGNFVVTNAGAVTAVGVNSGSGLLQGTGGLTLTGTTQINASGSGTTTIGGASAGNISLQSGGTIGLTGTTNINTTGTASTSIGNATGTLTFTGASTFNGAVGISGTNTLTVGTGLTSLGGGLSVTAGTTTLSGNLLSNGNTTIGDATTDRLTVTSQILGATPLVFQGATDNGFATSFSFVDPTGNNTITFPNSSGTVTLNPTSGNYLQQVPTSNTSGAVGANVIAPTAASVVGITVNATSGTSAVAAIFNQSQTADGVQINTTNTSGTQANGVLINRNGAGGTTTNLLNLTNTAGTTTTGLMFTGTFGNLIDSDSGNFSVSNGGLVSSAGGFSASALVTSNALALQAATPAAAGNASLLRLGSAIAGGSSNGTFLGINAVGGYTGDYANFQVNGTSTFKVSGAGAITGVTASLTGATSGDALTVSNSTSTGSIAVFKDNSTAVLTLADGGAATFRNSVDSSVALQVQNANGGSVLNVSNGSGAVLTIGRPATGSVGHVANVVNTAYFASSTTNRGFSPSQSVPSGHTLIGSLVTDAPNGITPGLTVTDNKGNTYTTDAQYNFGSTAIVSVFSGYINTPLTTSDTITLTLSNSYSRWAVTIEDFDNILTSPVDQTAVNGASSTTSLNSGTTASTTASNELIFAAFGHGVPRTFTPGSGYTATTQVATAGGSPDRANSSEWKYVSSTGTQSATGTLNTNSTYAAAIVTYKSGPLSDTGLPGTIAVLDGASSGYAATLGVNTLSANRAINLPNEAGTLCVQNSTNCGFLSSTTGVQLQSSTPGTPQTGHFNISGTGILGGGLTVTGATSINTTGTASTSIGNATGTLTFTGASTFNGAVGISGTNTLTVGTGLTTLGGGLTLTGTTQINASGSAATTIGSTSAGAVSITSGAASSFTTNAGNLTLQAGSGTVTLGASSTLTAAGGLTVTSGGANALAVDAGGAAALNLGITNANAVSIAKSGVTTTVGGGTLFTPSAGFSSGTNGATVTASLLTNSTVVPITATTTSLTFNMPTGMGSAGKIVYITNGGSNSFLLNIGASTLNFTTTSAATLYWNGSAWISAGLDAGVTSVGTFTGASIANGASISNNTITFGAADATNPGLVSTGNQSLLGTKTFNTGVTVGTGSAGTGAGLFTNTGATLNQACTYTGIAGNTTLNTANKTPDVCTAFTVATTASVTITVPSPTTTTAGRIVYISNTGSSSFTLLSSTLAVGSTATLLWNGSAWTFAGADGSSILNQSSAVQTANFNIQSSAAGTSTAIIQGAASATAATLVVRSGTSQTGSIVEVEASDGSNYFAVTPAAITNLAANGDAETSGTFTTNWTTVGTSTIARNTTTFAAGAASASAAMGTTLNNGIRNNLGTAPSTSTTYGVSFSARLTAGTNLGDIEILYSRDGGTNTVPCSYSGTYTITTSSWVKVGCSFTADSTTATNADLIIRQPTAPASARTLLIDNLVVMNTTGTSAPAVTVGGATSNGPTVFTLDQFGAAPFASGNTAYYGSMYFDTTLGKIQCYEADGWGACGAAPNNIITLTPEYTGAVLNGTGIGTLTADLCANGGGLTVNTSLCSSGEAKNYYKWTSPQGTAQTYSIYVSYQLPNGFKSFVSGQTSLIGRTDSASSTVQYSVYKSTGSSLVQCGSAVSVSTGSQSTWQTGTASGTADPSNCGGQTFAAGNYVVFKIDVIANSNANAYVGNLNFQFTNQ